jgi:hypothetical protein
MLEDTAEFQRCVKVALFLVVENHRYLKIDEGYTNNKLEGTAEC